MKSLVAVALLAAAGSGCTSTRISAVETGLFENDPEKMTAAYEALEKKVIGREALTLADLECLGFDLKAPNIEPLTGTIAFKRIFGDSVFRDKNGVEKPDFNLDTKYRGYVIPYRWIETTSDRIYISEYEEFRKGTQVQILLLLKQDQPLQDLRLYYCELQRARIDTYFSHYALFEGLIIMIKAPGKAALGIMEKLQEYQRPGLEYFVPIPIP